MPYPLSTVIEVHWRDANGRSGWMDISVYEAHTTANCKTVGYLLKNTREEITVVLSQCDNEDLNQCITIPKAWVRKIKVLRRGNGK